MMTMTRTPYSVKPPLLNSNKLNSMSKPTSYPKGKEEFIILLQHFKSTYKDPNALWTHIHSWNNDNNE
jgi:hypothetical protein